MAKFFTVKKIKSLPTAAQSVFARQKARRIIGSEPQKKADNINNGKQHEQQNKGDTMNNGKF